MTSLKQPPVFNPDGGDNYADWKNDLEVWCMLTDGKINQGPAVYSNGQNKREFFSIFLLIELFLKHVSIVYQTKQQTLFLTNPKTE